MDKTYQLKLALLRKAAIAADAVVRSHTPGTVPNATAEQMQTAKLYMTLAVPGFILALFDEIDRLKSKSCIELNAYQLRALLEMAEASDTPEEDPIVIMIGDKESHSGPGLYAMWRECQEEGSDFIGENEDDQQRGNKLAEEFEASQEVQP